MQLTIIVFLFITVIVFGILFVFLFQYMESAIKECNESNSNTIKARCQVFDKREEVIVHGNAFLYYTPPDIIKNYYITFIDENKNKLEFFVPFHDGEKIKIGSYGELTFKEGYFISFKQDN